MPGAWGLCLLGPASVQPPQAVSQCCWRMGMAAGQVKQQGTLFAPHPAYARIILRAKQSSAEA